MSLAESWADPAGDEREETTGFDSSLVQWSVGLTQFPDQALLPNRLAVLDLRYNKICAFPSDMSLLTGLQHLDLTRNRVEVIPDEICLWQNLRGLFLGNNRLATLPGQLGQLSALQWLRLDHNRLVELPWELGGMASLAELGLEYNRLTSLPPELAQLSRLHLLKLWGNPMIPPSGTRLRNAAPSAVGESVSASFLPDEKEADRCHVIGRPAMNRQAHDSLLAHLMGQLLYQDLSWRELTDVPESVLRTTSLQALVMAHNRLEELPDALGMMCNLRVLDVSNNLLPAIPHAFSTLVHLQEINWAHNRMRNTTRETHQSEETCIPKEVGYLLTRLETLLLPHNHLRWLPQAVPHFPLVRLDLSHNVLDYLPTLSPRMPMVATLQVLVLSHNRLVELHADNLLLLTRLQELALESNQLSKLPFALGALTSLELLWAGATRDLHSFVARYMLCVKRTYVCMSVRTYSCWNRFYAQQIS